jgi:rubrerythrin
MKPLETTPEEVLRDAIQSEVETRAYYEKLAERAGSSDVKKRLMQLADDEMLHRAQMERKYRETFKKAPPDPKPVKVEIPNELLNLDMGTALKHALYRERDSESYYRFMAERVPDTELGRLFMELAEIEWKHKTDLQAEYDRVTSMNPDQFLMDL